MLADHEVLASIDRLKALGLARIVHAVTGSRATKYRQVLDERLQLDDAERAVLTLLLLRGAQTPGELRSRAERLHAFADSAEAERALGSLRDRTPPLVAEHERRPGQRERRWVHLLGPAATAGVAAPAPPVDVGEAAAPPLGAWVEDPSDGWLLVRLAAEEVDRTIDAVARALGPASRLRLSVRSPDDILDVLAHVDPQAAGTERLYALAPMVDEQGSPSDETDNSTGAGGAPGARRRLTCPRRGRRRPALRSAAPSLGPHGYHGAAFGARIGPFASCADAAGQTG